MDVSYTVKVKCILIDLSSLKSHSIPLGTPCSSNSITYPIQQNRCHPVGLDPGLAVAPDLLPPRFHQSIRFFFKKKSVCAYASGVLVAKECICLFIQKSSLIEIYFQFIFRVCIHLYFCHKAVIIWYNFKEIPLKLLPMWKEQRKMSGSL